MTAQDNRQLAPSNDGSWGRQLAPLEGIQLDIVHLLADHSDVGDLRVLGNVSKPLKFLLGDPGIWKKKYKRSEFFLPPGPFDWQSTSYLLNALLRAEKLYSVWPSSLSCPEIQRTRSMSFTYDTSVSVLLGRWLLVVEGSSLVCYDSQCSNTPGSAKTLFDAGRRILHVHAIGSTRDDGILAFVVPVFNDSFTIAKVLVDDGMPSSTQDVFTSAPTAFEGWTELLQARLYHRLLVVNIGNYSSDWELSGRLVIMDVVTLRRYRIASSTDDTAFSSMHSVTFFFATRTHLIKTIESTNRFKVQFQMECFPLPTASEARECDVLYPSHRSRVISGPKLRDCVVIHESPIDLGTGKMSFAVCGLNAFPDGGRLEIMEVCLEPDGNISFMAFGFNRYLVTSFCLGSSRQHAYGVALKTDGQPLVFALDLQKPGSFSFKYCVLDRQFPVSRLLALDTFEGTAFFSRWSSCDTSVEMVDFVRDACKAEGRLAVHVPGSQLSMPCDCGQCYLRA